MCLRVKLNLERVRSQRLLTSIRRGHSRDPNGLGFCCRLASLSAVPGWIKLAIKARSIYGSLEILATRLQRLHVKLRVTHGLSPLNILSPAIEKCLYRIGGDAFVRRIGTAARSIKSNRRSTVGRHPVDRTRILKDGMNRGRSGKHDLRVFRLVRGSEDSRPISQSIRTGKLLRVAERCVQFGCGNFSRSLECRLSQKRVSARNRIL